MKFDFWRIKSSIFKCKHICYSYMNLTENRQCKSWHSERWNVKECKTWDKFSIKFHQFHYARNSIMIQMFRLYQIENSNMDWNNSVQIEMIYEPSQWRLCGFWCSSFDCMRQFERHSYFQSQRINKEVSYFFFFFKFFR